MGLFAKMFKSEKVEPKVNEMELLRKQLEADYSRFNNLTDNEGEIYRIKATETQISDYLKVMKGGVRL
jgi:hypothetical protein